METPRYHGVSEKEQTFLNAGGQIGTPVGRYAKVQALAAAGSVIGDAGAITVPSGGMVVVSAADDTKGVRLPVPDADGYIVYIKSTVASKILKVWPSTGLKINETTASTAFSLASGKLCALLIYDATNSNWNTFPLLPS